MRVEEPRQREERRSVPPPLPARQRAEPPLPLAPPEPAAPPIAGLPAEAPSALERFNPQALRRKWWWDRWRETPCWLTSMVTHLALLLVVGSLAGSPTRRPGVTTWTLVLGSENQRLAEADLVVVQTDDRKQDGGERGDQLEQPPLADAPKETADEPPAAEQAVSESATRPPAENPGEHDIQDHADTIPQPEPRPAIHLVSAATTVEGEAPKNGPPPAGGPSAAWDQNPIYEDIVERFIEYDIGRLRGREGERARRDFETLGPYAIPALVRGLNKSASIQASCPVVVIASKLENALAQSGDYEMIRYAVDNLGRDVPENAPHLARLRALRESLRRTHIDPAEETRRDLIARGIEPTEELTWRAMQLSSAPPAEVAAALDSSHAEERLAATVAAARCGADLTDGQRLHLAERLLLRLDDPSGPVGVQAEAALAALLKIDPHQAPRTWGDRGAFWRARFERIDRDRVERIASALLTQAKVLEQRGRTKLAAERYRRLVEEYPATFAAHEAAARLRQVAAIR